ncbi:MAG: ATP-binding cassette domain-containing protein, partial [Pseudonocardiaceae bacterium]|nr:ATP-binding cassette domain-containing protein [Pseudonocardiaceae bacterium]
MLRVDKLSKTYGHGERAVHAIGELSFEVGRGEFVSIVDPSRAGKTTLLKCLSGLLAPTSGSAVLTEEPITGPPPGLAMVFQEYNRSLLPWSTIARNVDMPLRNQRMSKQERQRRTTQALSVVVLDRFADYYPWQLSGGMQQRVAIARALAYEPQLLLMDEPFASVDAQTRADLEDLVLQVREDFDVTILFVTHDIDEAVYVSDRVVVLSPAPTTVREIVDIALPRPRDQVTTKEDPEFARLR